MTDTQTVINKLDSIYGNGRGVEVYTTIMPGIISDFNKMLEKAGKGESVSEQYNLEDRRGIIKVTGNKLKSGQAEISIDVVKI